jgi:hypothetical protein
LDGFLAWAMAHTAHGCSTSQCSMALVLPNFIHPETLRIQKYTSHYMIMIHEATTQNYRGGIL